MKSLCCWALFLVGVRVQLEPDNLESSLWHPKCLLFHFPWRRKGGYCRTPCTGCWADSAVSWPRAIECEKLSNFKTALGQFNKLLPPPSSPHFWILKYSLPSKTCTRVEGFWNANNAEFYSTARWILRGSWLTSAFSFPKITMGKRCSAHTLTKPGLWGLNLLLFVSHCQ